ncbi:MAG: alanine racemase [Chloroflexi bacterium]|nr:alanine racemase [Chloroflexota bacterium]
MSTNAKPGSGPALDLDGVPTPALLIDLDRVRANLARSLAIIGGADRWRPHVKTAKVAAVQQLMLEAGLRHFKCATTREARVLLDLARDGGHSIDLLLAMALRGPNLARYAAIAAAHPGQRLSLLSEDPAHAAAVRGLDAGLGLYLDLDPGMGRTGIPLLDWERIASTRAAAGSALRGLHAYEGQFGGIPLDQRPAAADALYPRLVELAERLELGEAELVTSGTPAFALAAGHPAFAGRRHRVSPGTVVYWDLTSVGSGLDGYAFAATVLATVVSRPAAGRLTVDAGSKAVDAAAGDPCAAVVGLPGLRALRPSEEHLPMARDGGPMPELGQRLRLIPRHVCPTVNLADEALLIEGGRVTARVPVAARGHETAG